jgi:putative drug exporter of the RND superfamily
VTGPLYRLAGLCVRRAPWVILLWIVAVVVVVLVAKSTGEDTNDDLTLPGSDSTAAQDLLEAHFPKQQFGSNPVVLATASGKLTDSANRKVVKATVKSLKSTPHVNGVISPLSQAGEDQISKDGTIGYASVTLNIGPTDLDADEANAVIAAADPARNAGWRVAVAGYIGQEVSKSPSSKSDAIGLLAAMVILLFAFGTVVAMGLPILTAVLGLAGSLSLIALISHVINVPTQGPVLATMIGLGVGIDYALFIVTRHRQQMHDGIQSRESAARAVATAGGAVVFAGSTVVVALCSLAIAGIPIVSALGYTAAIAVVVAVLAAVTLMPALLGALGPRIESLRLPISKRFAEQNDDGGWFRWARWISRRPWLALISSLAILAILAAPTRLLHLGANDVAQQPTDTTARQAYDLLTSGLGAGFNGPFLVAVDLEKKAHPDQQALNKIDRQKKKLNQQLADAKQQAAAATAQAEAQGVPPAEASQQPDAQLAATEAKINKNLDKLNAQYKQVNTPESDPRLQNLSKQIGKAPGMKSVTPALVNKEGNAAVLTGIPTTSPANRTTEDTVRNLRSTTIPEATKGKHMTAYVGGTTPAYIDLADRISDHLVELIAIVVGLSFILLMLAFRSIVVPLKAGIMNLISISAAYGVVTFVFQQGHQVTALGLDHAVPIVSFVPLLMFAILFGLSMDYEVFLITQIQEHYRATGDNEESIVQGLGRTGKVITSAALIMVCVFASFVFNGDPTIKQFGLGLAVAIAVDATIVRCLLVPAAMILMKNANWWFPDVLERHLPHLGIEGEEYFAARDAEAAAAETKPKPSPVEPVEPEPEPVEPAPPAVDPEQEPEPSPGPPEHP